MTQKETVLNHLRQYGSISSWEAIERYNITRLGAHIEVLRNDEGFNITGENCHNERTHWKVYHLGEGVRQEYKTLENGQLSLI